MLLKLKPWLFSWCWQPLKVSYNSPPGEVAEIGAFFEWIETNNLEIPVEARKVNRVLISHFIHFICLVKLSPQMDGLILSVDRRISSHGVVARTQMWKPSIPLRRSTSGSVMDFSPMLGTRWETSVTPVPDVQTKECRHISYIYIYVIYNIISNIVGRLLLVRTREIIWFMVQVIIHHH